MADECLFDSEAGLIAFLDFLAEKRHIDPETWAARRIVVLPAMQRRADTYARSKGRGKAGLDRADAGDDSPEQTPTSQDKTSQENTAQLLFADAGPKRGTTVEQLVEAWNRLRTKGPKVERITKPRRGQYARALVDHPNLQDWERAITWLDSEAWANAPGTGQHATWRADLDYLARPGKLQKALERISSAPVQAAAKPGRIAAERGKYAHLERS